MTRLSLRCGPPPLGAVLVIVAALVAGCAGGRASRAGAGSGEDSVPVGQSAHSIAVDGAARTFLTYRPASLTGPAPLVVMIHGGGGTAAAAERLYGWDAQADSGHFIVAYPDGLYRGWSVGGDCCHFSSPISADDDVAFISHVVDAVSRAVPVDPRRVYATGISEGGMMSYRLACQTTTFAAIGPDSATLLGECPSPAPLSVIHIHGTADARIPYDGSPGAGVHHIDGPATPALNATWRAIDRCSAPQITVADTVTTSTASCADDRTVELISIAGAGHQWPGMACNARCGRGLGDASSTALDATQTIWRFFAAHPKP